MTTKRLVEIENCLATAVSMKDELIAEIRACHTEIDRLKGERSSQPIITAKEIEDEYSPF